MTKPIDRRQLVGNSLWTSLALVLPLNLPERRALAASSPKQVSTVWAPNAFLSIEPDNSITVYAKHLEMGQGVYTGLATILAEELDADWANIKVKAAPADASLYANLAFGKSQATGGSTSIANSWEQLRVAGAQGRAVLMQAAAKLWKVPLEQLTTTAQTVQHGPSKKSASYGSLVHLARLESIPSEPQLKDKGQFRLVGKDLFSRIDAAQKGNGAAVYGSDFAAEGMLVAMVERPPLFGAKLGSFDAESARKTKGVLEILAIPQGVAVIANSFVAANKARAALTIKWDTSKAYQGSDATIHEQYHKLLNTEGSIAFSQGDWSKEKTKASKVLTADYVFPFLAHAPMETLSCVVKLDKDGCEIWAGSQSPTRDQARAAEILQIKPEQVLIHTLYAGGSFGRRATPTADYISEAVSIAKASKFRGRPIKLLWTRADDIKGGYYRPYTMHRVVAGLDGNGKPSFWHQRIVSQSLLKTMGAQLKDGIDPTTVEGAANLAYAIPHRQCELHSPELEVPVLWWRSVGHTHTAFVAETAIDELASLAGQDPLRFRLSLTSTTPRHQAVLTKVAAMANWEQKRPPGVGLGLAVHQSFGSVVAEIAEVSITGTKYRVNKVWCAVDCGIAVNPNIVKAQMEGGIGYGLSALQSEAIRLQEGRVVASNFHDYKILRHSDMPQIEVAILASDADPSGVGEPGLPPIAPAVANAIFQATGKRLRQLPLSLT